jgi:hypothetical protein
MLSKETKEIDAISFILGAKDVLIKWETANTVSV